MFLVIVVALGIHFPVFTAQTSHDAHLAYLGIEGGIERMGVHRIDEAVVVAGILHHTGSLPVVGEP